MSVPVTLPTDVVLKNSVVQFLLRRLVQKATDMFHHFRSVTEKFVESRGDKSLDVDTYWRLNLPSVALWNTLVQRTLAAEFLAEVDQVDDKAMVAYILFCRLNYGRDVHGNINVLRVVKPPFYEFFHAFLTRLASSPEMTRMAALVNPAHMDSACSKALCDALHDVSVSRVTITETMSRREYKRAQKLAHGTPAEALSVSVPVSIPVSAPLPVSSLPISVGSTPESANTIDVLQSAQSIPASTPAPVHVKETVHVVDETPVFVMPPSKSPSKSPTPASASIPVPNPVSLPTEWQSSSVISSTCSGAWSDTLSRTQELDGHGEKRGLASQGKQPVYVMPHDSSSQIHSMGNRHKDIQQRHKTAASHTAPSSALDQWRLGDPVSNVKQADTTKRRVSMPVAPARASSKEGWPFEDGSHAQSDIVDDGGFDDTEDDDDD